MSHPSAGESLASHSSSPIQDEVAPIESIGSISRIPLPSHSSSSSTNTPSSLSNGRSPRCEAFVMTGDKILNLNPNISPSYAKVARDQLPPRMSIHESPQSTSTLISSLQFPSTKRGRIHSSISQPEGVTANNIESKASKMARVPMNEEIENVIEEVNNIIEDMNEDNEDDDKDSPTLFVSTHSRNEGTNSNPHIMNRDTRTCSSDTFVLAPESPSMMSTVTVNGICHVNISRIDGSSLPSSPLSYPRPPLSSNTPTRSSSISRWITHAVLSPWSGIRIDAALREFISQVELKGETSNREQILMHFSRRYFYANTTSFTSFDEVHGLACGLLLLNSDLHNRDNTKKMLCREFIHNMGHTGYDYSKPLLKTLYQSIKNKALVYAGEPSEEVKDKKWKKNKKSQPYLPLEMDPRSQIEYKRGYLMRKVVYDSDGSPTPVGRRGWRMVYVRVRALALYISRDENEPPLYNALSGSVLLHHSLAERAIDYTKRKNVFRLRTASLGEILFQASTEREVESWIHSLNLVSSTFSSRSLAPALDSTGNLSWPRLPRIPSTAGLEEQLSNHENALVNLRSELTRLQSNAPPVRTKGKQIEKYFFNERLLMQEMNRYEVYCTVLRSRLDGTSYDSGIVSKASNAPEDSDRISYREAMHIN